MGEEAAEPLGPYGAKRRRLGSRQLPSPRASGRGAPLWGGDESDEERASPGRSRAAPAAAPAAASTPPRMDPAAAAAGVAPLQPAPADQGAAPPGAPRPFTQCACRSVRVYKRVQTLSEGAYGVVHQAADRSTGQKVALKKIKFGEGQGHSADGMPASALREISLLLSISHPNIVAVREAVVGDTPDEIYLVMEYVEHDVRKLITKESEREKGYGWRFTAPQAKCLMSQLLSATQYLHSRWILHRDLKTNNLLYGNNGVLKVCDFGMARAHSDPPQAYTPLQWVLTLPFRPPEGLLGAASYGTSVDMWSVGCIFAELLQCKPLFKPQNPQPELDMLEQIFTLLGTPREADWPEFPRLLQADPAVALQGERRGQLNLPEGWRPRRRLPPTLRDRFPAHGVLDQVALTSAGFDLLCRLLSLNPAARPSAADALCHPYLTEDPAACTPEQMPQFRAQADERLAARAAAKHARSRRSSAAPPPRR
eukprot:TRINITY_DN13492_c0_g1_i1.p1 TRINITY_DN13492_c0_g1~~TRINITY_DN13492_c0_g1_i1.p1  ORF type:complete len:481 (+),score=162.45 TRINITY_DN13492_c0_g1_i1:78-1520(+)